MVCKERREKPLQRERERSYGGVEGTGRVPQYRVCQVQMWSPDTSRRHTFPLSVRTGLFLKKILGVGCTLLGSGETETKSALYQGD